MANDLTLGVLLGATLKSGFAGTFGTAGKSVSELGKTIKQTHAQLGQVNDYVRLDGALGQTRTKLADTQKQAMALRKEMAAGDGSAKLAKNLEKTEAKAVKLSSTLETQRTKLRQSGDALRKAGIDTNDLSTANEKLTATYNRQRAELGKTAALTARRSELVGQLRGQIVKLGGALLAARPLLMWSKDAAVFDGEMQNIGNTNDLTAAQIASLKDQIFAASKETGQYADKVQFGVGKLVAAGLSVDVATASIRTIGKTATAEAAEVGDLSDAAIALHNNLNVKPEGLATAFNILTQAGKEGNVELKDMAKHLPTLSASMNSVFKMTGPRAIASMGAALEIARKGTGDADSAANNLNNFMQKVMSPTALAAAKKNFGLDLYKVITDAQKSGANPFEAAIDAIRKTTKGDGKALGQIFQDMQVQGFLRPMMQHWDEYKRVKDAALDSDGVVDRDFEKVRQTTKQQTAELGQAWDRFKKSTGTALGAAFGRVATAITPLVNTIGELAKRFPKLVVGVIAAAGAMLTFNTALIGFKLLGTFVSGNLLKTLVPGLGMVQKGLMGATVAMRALGIASIANPIGLIVAGIAAAAFLVYKYWEPIKAFFKGVWKSVSEAAGPAFDALGKSMKGLNDAMGGTFQQVQATQNGLKSATDAGVSFGEGLGAVLGVLARATGYIANAFVWVGTAIGESAGWIVVHMGKAADAVKSMWNGALGFVGGLWDGLQAKVGAVVDWIMGKLQWVADKWNTLKGIPGAVVGGLRDAGTSIGNTVGNVWAGAGGATPAMAGAYPMPTMASRGHTTVDSHDTTTIQIHATPGMDVRAVGDEVQRRLDDHARKQAARQRSKLGDRD